jgi:hypothetical protein
VFKWDEGIEFCFCCVCLSRVSYGMCFEHYDYSVSFCYYLEGGSAWFTSTAVYVYTQLAKVHAIKGITSCV